MRRLRAPAADLHARGVEVGTGREVWVLDVERPALVLGSTQPDGVVDRRAAAGFDLVRRRSGGGAVVLRPGAQVWIDVVVPPDDPLWVPDIGRSFLWLGETWQQALAAVGVPAEVHRSRPVPAARGSAADLACFAGRGWGEVEEPAGRGPSGKIVGLAQRRTRAGARFQSVCYLTDPGPLPLLGLGAKDQQAAAPAPVPVPAGELIDAVLAALP